MALMALLRHHPRRSGSFRSWLTAVGAVERSVTGDPTWSLVSAMEAVPGGRDIGFIEEKQPKEVQIFDVLRHSSCV